MQRFSPFLDISPSTGGGSAVLLALHVDRYAHARRDQARVARIHHMNEPLGWVEDALVVGS